MSLKKEFILYFFVILYYCRCCWNR